MTLLNLRRLHKRPQPVPHQNQRYFTMERLPEDCMDRIIKSPIEACRMSSVSRASHNVMDSDTMWQKFLPSDYKKIISRLVHPIKYSSKKELFFKLCNPLHIDNDTKVHRFSQLHYFQHEFIHRTSDILTLITHTDVLVG